MKKKTVQDFSTVVHIEVKAHPLVKENLNVETLRLIFVNSNNVLLHRILQETYRECQETT